MLLSRTSKYNDVNGFTKLDRTVSAHSASTCTFDQQFLQLYNTRRGHENLQQKVTWQRPSPVMRQHGPRQPLKTRFCNIYNLWNTQSLHPSNTNSRGECATSDGSNSLSLMGDKGNCRCNRIRKSLCMWGYPFPSQIV